MFFIVARWRRRLLDPAFEEKLKGLSSRMEIERSVKELCAPFGGVRGLRLFPDGRGGQFCFFEPATPAHRMTLFYAFDALFYGDGMMFRIP
jgi:hypothetical protein